MVVNCSVAYEVMMYATTIRAAHASITLSTGMPCLLKLKNSAQPFSEPVYNHLLLSQFGTRTSPSSAADCLTITWVEVGGYWTAM